jgi:predicted small secreted protein
MRIKRTRSVAGVVVGLSLLMAACGDDTADEPAT